MSLNPSQQKVIHCHKHCVVIACPGSGKTRVIAYKAEHISRVDPQSRIVVATFGTDAAAEIKERITQVTGSKFKSHVASGTFHALANNQLRRAGIIKKPIQGSEVSQLVERALEECNLPNLSIDDAIAYIDNFRINMRDEHSSKDLEQLFKCYIGLLDQINATDFTGMISEAVEKMQNGEIPPKDCKYIFCDEAQDMDPLQHEWCLQHIKAGATLTLVGDDDQSIYRFRSSLGLQGMLNFKNKLGAETIILDTNYRSHCEILNAAGKVIANNIDRIDKKLISHRGMGGIIEAWHCKSALREANLVVKRIKGTCIDNEILNPAKYSVGVREGEWAVLARNHHNLNVLAMALKIEGIPHSTPEQDIWVEEPVCFAIGLLTSVVEESRAGIESAMFYAGYSQKVLSKCAEIYGKDISEFIYCAHELDLIELGEETAKSLVEFTHVIQKLLFENHKGNVNFVVRSAFDWMTQQIVLRDGKITNDRKKKGKAKDEKKLMAIACRLLTNIDGTLKHRLQKVTSRRESGKKDEKKVPEVYLNTLHSSKGLEFDNVWLLQIDDLVIPDIKQFTKKAIEEERRLFYVGMTRAKKSLYISCTKCPSQFIFETDVELKSV